MEILAFYVVAFKNLHRLSVSSHGCRILLGPSAYLTWMCLGLAWMAAGRGKD